MILALCVFLAILGIPLAHGVARWIALGRRAGAGHSRDVMPALPTTPPTTGRAERRWDAQVSKLEGALLERFEGGARGVEAQALAAQLGAEPAHVEAALAQLREAMPCRLQVTRSGKLLHDFEAADVAAMRAARRLAWPRRVAFTALGAFANIGAAWPLIATGGLATLALLSMASVSTTDEALVIGVIALIGVALLFGVTLLAGAISGLLMRPWINAPKLGSVRESEAVPQYLAAGAQRIHPRDSASSMIADAAIFSAIYSPPTHRHPVSTSGSSSSWTGDLDFDGDGLPALLVVVVVALLLAVVAGSLFAVGVWLRGLWRAVQRLAEPERDVAPSRWVREADTIDRYERWIPTNDLVLRTMHALRRVYVSRRPADGELASRVLVLARARGGLISALEIALYEGLDLDEAAEVGARLTGLLEGQITVSPLGDLAFRFPDALLAQVVAKPVTDLAAEYVDFESNGRIARRRQQEADSVPVNLVGLSYAHLRSMGRLVGGTYLMAIMGLLALSALSASALIHGLFGLTLVAMVWGVTGLVALANYTARVEAVHGVQRDMRRAAVRQVRDALERGAASIDLTDLARRLSTVFYAAWEDIDEALAKREVRGVCVDLGLELELEAGGREVFKLAPLRERLKALAEVSPAFDDEVIFAQDDGDPVMFDTQLSHERVSATM